ncbi:MAG: hypothetical protein WCZ89_07080 [Phycisphaerae bacterium]
MKTQLNVIKSDSSIEEYMHTKVLHTINRALVSSGEHDTDIAEHLAEVITYFLYSERAGSAVPSSQILAAIKISLASTGYEAAAEILTEHHYHRRLNRNRVEVVYVDGEEISDPEQFMQMQEQAARCVWSKSVIIDDLVNRTGLDRSSARTIAAMVEEKILGLQISRISSSLVKQLVLNDTAAVLYAQKQLQTA